MRSVDLVIERIVQGGDGLARTPDGVVFVPGTIPGERVRVSMTQRRKGFSRAALEEILEASPSRVAPPCPFFGDCGGCTLQHLAIEEQRLVKAALFREALSRIGGIKEEEPFELLESKPWAYRNRVQFHADEQGRAGFMAAHSDRVVSVDRCPVCVESVNRFLAEGGRRTAGSRFVVFGTDTACRQDGDEVELIVGGRPIAFRADGFFQSNLGILDDFTARVGEYASGAGGILVDLYAGVGLFGSLLVDRYDRVYSVELEESALAFAHRNLDGRGTCVAAGAEAWLAGPGVGMKASCVIVDPPRTGLSEEARIGLLNLRPPRLVYASCDPATFARDAAVLLRGGYRFEAITLFDFYPQTTHFETVALFKS